LQPLHHICPQSLLLLLWGLLFSLLFFSCGWIGCVACANGGSSAMRAKCTRFACRYQLVCKHIRPRPGTRTNHRACAGAQAHPPPAGGHTPAACLHAVASCLRGIWELPAGCLHMLHGSRSLCVPVSIAGPRVPRRRMCWVMRQ